MSWTQSTRPDNVLSEKSIFLLPFRRSNNSNHIVIFVYKRAISVDKKKTTALKKVVWNYLWIM